MLNIVAHYSFDYEQQVTIFCDIKVYLSYFFKGSLSFKSTTSRSNLFCYSRKCGIFGGCCEAIPQQVNFLIDESFDTGKGANLVISMVHFYLKNHGLNSVSIHFNADNCKGQNKYNTVLQVSKMHAQECNILRAVCWKQSLLVHHLVAFDCLSMYMCMAFINSWFSYYFYC